MIYKILLQRSSEGYSVSCPRRPGCWSEGQTREEAIENIGDAIREYLVALNDLAHVRLGGIPRVRLSA
jgi:predicted RNase H-like HicB family nuclease